MTFSKGALSLVTVLIIFLGLGAGVFLRLSTEEDGSGDEDVAQEALAEAEEAGITVPTTEGFDANRPQLVTGAPVVRDTLWISVTAAGEAEAARRARLANRVDGVVLSVAVDEDEVVEEGQLLLQIDTTEYALAVREAEADLVDAQADYQERMILAGEIADPAVREERERLARAAARLDQFEAALERAKMELEQTRVRAPFTGRVADLEVVEGEYLPAQTELITVMQLDPLRVSARVLEAEMAYLRPGRRANVSFAAFPGETLEARIRSINPVVDPDSRTARVTLELPNPDGRLKPGMYARVSLEAQEYPDRILVPRGAVLERDRRTMVFMLRDPNAQGEGVAEWRYVTTGFESDDLVEIVPSDETSMLEPGEIVLVDGHHYLAHDRPVQATNYADLAATANPAEDR